MLKKSLLVLGIVISYSFTASSQEANSAQASEKIENQTFNGTWQVHVNVKEKEAFEAVKNSVIEEAYTKVSDNREANSDSSIDVKGYKILIMSEEKVNKGFKWPQIQYVN